MMPRLPDKTIAERQRARVRASSQQMRERQHAKGNVSLTVWVPAEARANAQELARQQRVSIGEVVGRALSRLPAAQGDGQAIEWD